ncbi:MAG: uracil-DNA glycosylase [Desulfobaccales bacterium]
MPEDLRPEDFREELLELTLSLEEWLRFQRRLGAKGAPRPAAEAAPPADSRPERPTLAEIREELGDCRRCKLAGGRTHIVFGEGSPQARLMFIGEGPGAEEDLQGRPFVGPAGQLLNNLLAKLGLRREEVYIANIVKCRPPGNRDPEPDEVAACLPFLLKQIDSIRPLVIVTLGRPATQNLLKTEAPISKLRGIWQKYKNIKVMPTFHPSYLLRAPKERLKTWHDMQQVLEYLAAHEAD